VSLAILDATHEGEHVGLRAEGGRIVELGPGVEAREGDEAIDAAGMPLVPGLLNGHTHAAMTLFRGYGDDLPLMEWLEQKIWPAEARLDADDVYWATRLACAEMICTGTVRFWDMYWQPGATARAVEEAGLRATIGAPLLDGNDPSRTDELKEGARSGLAELAGTSDRISAALAPHAIYSVSETSLRWIVEEADDRALPIHIHVSETEKEVADCVSAHGLRPVAYLDRLGLLGPRTLLAHAVWLDDAELDLVAERGATLVTNPVANLKLAVGGVFQFRAARARGIPVALGTDGAGSNNSLDLLQDVKVFALLQKHEAGDPAAVTAEQAWEVATGAAAPLLGASGRLAPGEPADFLLLRADAPELSLGDLVADLVYAASGAVVDTTVVDGRVLMRGGVVEGLGELRERTIERAHRLGIAG
jgi:5-methylthioadenosine/S-adenosylhomocysteine deaminase